MSEYLNIAAEIWSWLASLQVSQKSIKARVLDGRFSFQLAHPAHGDVSVLYSIENKEIFSCEGLALRTLSRKHDVAEIEVYDAGGIFDPIDGRVQGEHYSTTHFALLSAILFSETREQKYLSAAIDAMAFHFRTSPTEYSPISSWMYHWDFQNYAAILTYRFLKDEISRAERTAWENGIRSWKTNHQNKLTNWAAMRAWAFAERSQLFRTRSDVFRMHWNQKYLKKARHEDGCFDDDFNRSRPIQYHVFTVAILHRLWQLTHDKTMKLWFEHGVDYFVPFIDPQGDYNYLGRGQQQIFGSAVAIYVLEAAHQMSGDPEKQLLANRAAEHLLQFKQGDHFPLVLNDRPDQERNGWYDYHHLTVYNAFLGAWLALTHLLKNSRVAEKAKPRTFAKFSRPTNVATVSRENYFAAFFGGLPEYLTEGGITPYHLWWRNFGVIFSCPGAPSPQRFSRLSPAGGEQNFMAPIATNGTGWIIPAEKTSDQFVLSDDLITMDYNYGPFAISRNVKFGHGELTFHDNIRFSEDRQFDEFRFFNFPIDCNETDVEIVDDTRVLLKKSNCMIALEIEGVPGNFELLETIPSARGLLRPLVKRKLNFAARRNQTCSIRFSIQGSVTDSNA
jgi:hypothetical protein